MTTPEQMERRKAIHELGEFERQAEELASYSRSGGMMERFWRWMAGMIRKDREELIEERKRLDG